MVHLKKSKTVSLPLDLPTWFSVSTKFVTPLVLRYKYNNLHLMYRYIEPQNCLMIFPSKVADVFQKFSKIKHNLDVCKKWFLW